MHKNSGLRITLTFFVSLSALCLFAQNDTILLQTAEVSSTRIPSAFSSDNRSLTVITRDDIASFPVTTLDELLEYALNTDVRQRGTPGAQSDISVRGGSYEQLAIMLNGVRINDPQTGHHNLNIPLDLNCIHRIEVLQGPGTRLYGPGAFSGAINIITAPPDDNGLQIKAESGDFRFFSSNVSLYTGKRSLKNVLSAGYKSTRGYRYNTDLKSGHVFWAGQHNGKNGVLKAQAGYNDKQFGANSFYSPLYPDQFEQTRVFLSSIRYEAMGRMHVKPQFYYRRHQDRFELFRNNRNAGSWYTSHNYHLTHVAGGEISSWFEWAGGRTSFGGDYRYECVFSNKLGEIMDTLLPVPFEKNAVFTRFCRREIATFYTDQQYTRNNFNISGGIMLYYSHKTSLKYLPGIDFSYRLTKPYSLFASYNHSIRLPSFTEMYYSTPSTHQGNPGLLPEEAINAEAGIRFRQTGIQWTTTLFYRNGNNIIDWVRANPSEKWQSANITSLQTAGAEVQVKAYVPYYYKKSPIQIIQVGTVYNVVQKSSADLYSLYAMDYIRCKFTGSVSHTLYKDISATWAVQWQQRAGTYTHPAGTEAPYPAFTTVDGRIVWKRNRFQLYADASNIFNSDYFDLGNLPMPGRWFRGGIIVSL